MYAILITQGQYGGYNVKKGQGHYDCPVEDSPVFSFPKSQHLLQLAVHKKKKNVNCSLSVNSVLSGLAINSVFSITTNFDS